MNDMVKILSGSASKYLGEGIAHSFGTELGNVLIQRFSDGEFSPSIEETAEELFGYDKGKINVFGFAFNGWVFQQQENIGLNKNINFK
jgi:hypothetical protein